MALTTIRTPNGDYEVDWLFVQVKYCDKALEDPTMAAGETAQIKHTMIQQLAEELYQCMDFSSHRNPNDWSAELRGKVLIGRRRMR